VKPLIKSSISHYAAEEFTKQIASAKATRVAVFTVSLLICAFCGVEGGYQLHLSHDHAALRCIQLGMPMVAGEQIDPLAYQVEPPPCKDPDELGQPWRLKLVLGDMLGFVIFGTLCFYKSHVAFARPAGN
jgi:hypothetical protein